MAVLRRIFLLTGIEGGSTMEKMEDEIKEWLTQ